jgi:hypothetical protein
VSNAERAKPVMKLQLGQVLPAGFIALCIACPRTGRKPKLTSHEGKKLCRRGLTRVQRPTWIP